jgi:rhodanese-related sulfurtransferase
MTHAGSSFENLPLPDIQNGALNLDAASFKAKYAFNKPPLDQHLLIACYRGVRAQTAAEIALAQGYTQVTNYVGSAQVTR